MPCTPGLVLTTSSRFVQHRICYPISYCQSGNRRSAHIVTSCTQMQGFSFRIVMIDCFLCADAPWVPVCGLTRRPLAFASARLRRVRSFIRRRFSLAATPSMASNIAIGTASHANAIFNQLCKIELQAVDHEEYNLDDRKHKGRGPRSTRSSMTSPRRSTT